MNMIQYKKAECIYSTRLILINKQAVAAKNTATTADRKVDRLHGSYHWNFERAVSAALVPLIGAQLTYGASPVLDTLLGVLVPIHVHIGKLLCIICAKSILIEGLFYRF